jgi:putative DNA primase/helicase
VRSDVFKRLITGEAVPARDVYRSATDFIPVALHLFSTNKLPSFSGGIDGGVLRRLLPVHFEHELDKREIDPDLVEKIIRDEADLLLDFVLEGACRLIQQRDFTIPASSQELLQKWITEADPVRGWAVERIEVCPEENFIAMSTLYADFKEWARREGTREDHIPTGKSFGIRLRTAEPRLKFSRSSTARQCRNAKFRNPNHE